MCFSDLYVANYKLVINLTIRTLVEKAIWDEIAFSNYVSPTKPRIVRALGAIPKPSSSKTRLIHNYSCPHGQVVNDYITTNSFGFQTLEKNAWIESVLLEKWVWKINSKMKVANLHILLFIDNCTAHVSSGPQKHKINFLPGTLHKQASAGRPRSNTKSESPLSPDSNTNDAAVLEYLSV